MVWGIRAFSLLALALLSGCVTDQTAPTAFSAAPGQATITITRPTAWAGMAIPVDIDLDGKRIASIKSGGTYSGPVPIGHAVLTATCWSAPGRYSTSFNAESGGFYSFQISPRGTQYAAAALGGVIGLVADTAANGDKSGAFVIVQANTAAR